jgi:CO/xanthine dehydrogenase Mo-binding subunit
MLYSVPNNVTHQLELRLKNYAGQDPDKMRPWSGKSGSMREGNTLIGWGMATAVYPARRSESSALARLNADRTILAEAGTQELGTGTYDHDPDRGRWSRPSTWQPANSARS